jgi:hypothetical protein
MAELKIYWVNRNLTTGRKARDSNRIHTFEPY